MLTAPARPRITTRSACIEEIEAAGKRAEFIEIFERSPEAYFEEYSYLEPDIWLRVLVDLQIA